MKKERNKGRRRWLRKTVFGLGIGKLVMVSSALLVGAVLISGFTWFSVMMETDIYPSGVEGSMFYVDGVLVNVQSGFDMGDDLSNIAAGMNLSFTHTFESDPNDGNWSLEIDTSPMDYFMQNESHEFYGLYFYTDQDNNEFTVDAGETVTVTFYYVLDSQFQQTPNPIPFDIDIDAVKV